MFSLTMLSSCKMADTLSANIYAQIESVSDTQLVLDMGTWENGTFASYEGETCVASNEIASINNKQGEKVEYGDLKAGDIIEIAFQTNVKTNKSTISVVLVQ